MSEFILIDDSNIVKVIYCLEDYYKHLSNQNDPYYDRSLYFVNNGTSDQGKSYSDLYLGSRKVTDLMILDEGSYPDDNCPDDKIYIIPTFDKEGRSVVNYQVCFKHKGVVSPIATNALVGAEYDAEAPSPQMVLKWSFQDGGGDLFTTRLLILNEDGSFPQAMMDHITETIYNDIASRVMTRWKSI